MIQTVSDTIQSGATTLVSFFAETCQACKLTARILDDIKVKIAGQVTFITIDVNKNPEVIRLYQIKEVPTLTLFKDGEIKWRQSGEIHAGSIEDALYQSLI